MCVAVAVVVWLWVCLALYGCQRIGPRSHRVRHRNVESLTKQVDAHAAAVSDAEARLQAAAQRESAARSEAMEVATRLADAEAQCAALKQQLELVSARQETTRQHLATAEDAVDERASALRQTRESLQAVQAERDELRQTVGYARLWYTCAGQ